MKLAVLVFFATVMVSVYAAISPPSKANVRRVAPRQGLTNGERMKRGLGPSRPRKLYQAKVKSSVNRNLDRRVVDGAPARAEVSSAGRSFGFLGCSESPGIAGQDQVSWGLTYTSLQDLANQCADLMLNFPTAEYQQFLIEDIDPQVSFNCYTGMAPSDSVDCDAAGARFAAYGA